MKKNYKISELSNVLVVVLRTLLILFLVAPFTTKGQIPFIENSKPTLDAPEDQIVRSNGDGRFIALRGITAGDEFNQTTSVSVSSSNSSLIEGLEVNPTSNGNAFIQYYLKKGSSGSALITVAVTDDGTPAATFSRSFTLKVEPVVRNSPVILEKIFKTQLDSREKKIILRGYPNPFPSNAEITFSTLRAQQKVNVDIYTVSGIKVQQLYTGSTEAGRTYTVRFSGSGMVQGLYIIRLTTRGQAENLKMILAK